MNSPGEIRQPFASVLLATLYFVAIVSPVLVAVLAVPHTDHSLLSEIAKNGGLVGIGILLLQFVLAGRLRWICNVFSLSEVMLFHRSMGLLAIALLLLHPVLLAVGEGDWSLIYGWSQPWYIWAGKLGLLALITHIVVSVFRTALKLSYERWRMTHDVLAVAIIGLTLVHSWFAGGDRSGFYLAGRPFPFWFGIAGFAPGNSPANRCVSSRCGKKRRTFGHFAWRGLEIGLPVTCRASFSS